MKIKEVMTKEPIVAEIPCSRNDVLRLLVTHGKTGVPVVRRKDKVLVGFVTRQDFFANPEEEQVALIMKKDYSIVHPSTDVRKAAEMFVKNDIHHMPVVKKNKLVGVVTPADLLIVVEEEKIDLPVEQIVQTPCIPVYENTPLPIASAMIGICNVYAFPALNDEVKLSGIITDRDLFNLSHINGSVVVSDLGLGEDENPWTWEGLRNIMKLYYEVSKIQLPNLMVKDVMVKKPVTVFRKSSVSEAARIMRKNDFGQLPIRDSEDRLLAMIYELDVISTLIE